MKNVVCWRAADVAEIINPEAEVVSPRIFRAVHSPFELRVSGPVGTEFQNIRPENYRSMTQEELLEDFLRPDVPYRRMAVFGRSGSGKSHLIHWLKLQIPNTPERRIVVVPKMGTSLRAILEMLIDELPPDQQVAFREALNKTGDSAATRSGQKTRLLNELAIAISERQPRPNSPDLDLERELIQVLPHLFNDVHFRQKYFLSDGTIISDLVDHVFAVPTAYRPVEQRRSFKLDDLPVDVRDLGDAAKLAGDALLYLQSVPIAPQLAVDLVNASLDTAIARALSFSGERLVSLMADLRRHLRTQGRELVLLIEDFARVQGLDRALLQAMIEQNGHDLCRLRWAIAVTTGFFSQIIDTVYTRIDLFVNMDRSAGRQASDDVRPKAVSDFAGPYLNAVRLGIGRLGGPEDADAGSPSDNACEGCDHQTICHETFGVSRHGYGLYPFTRQALWNMAQRVDENVEEAFNPRTVQKGVLIPTLSDAATALAVGAFPPAELLSQLGGYRALDPAARDELRRRVGPEEGRLGTLLELWDGSGKVVNLPEALRDAFSAPAIPDAAERGTEKPEEPVAEVKATFDTRSAEEREIDAWARGGPLDKMVNKLRPLIFEALSDSIDWDGLGLERTRFCSADGPRAFRRVSINFARQGVAQQKPVVKLEIPREGATPAEFDRAAIALSGLWRASRSGTWAFAGGPNALAAYLECLSEWQRVVVDQIQALVTPRQGWDPVQSAVELLAIGCAINGRIKAEADQVSDLSQLLEEAWTDDIAAVSPELCKVYQTLSSRREDLRIAVRALCSAGKGGMAGALINPSRVLAALKSLRANGWRLAQTPPSDLEIDPFRKCAELYRTIQATLEPAAIAERAARLNWMKEMEQAFGEAKRAAILETFGTIRFAVVDAGFGGNASRRLEEALDEFGKVQFDDAFAAVRALDANPDAVSALPAYARGRAGAIAASRRLAEAAEIFLSQTEGQLAEERSQRAAEAEAVANDLELIDRSLATVAASLETLESRDAA
jgi:hypothetical protein